MMRVRVARLEPTSSFDRELPERFPEYMFIWSAARAAAREFSVDYYGR